MSFSFGEGFRMRLRILIFKARILKIIKQNLKEYLSLCQIKNYSFIKYLKTHKQTNYYEKYFTFIIVVYRDCKRTNCKHSRFKF